MFLLIDCVIQLRYSEFWVHGILSWFLLDPLILALSIYLGFWSINWLYTLHVPISLQLVLSFSNFSKEETATSQPLWTIWFLVTISCHWWWAWTPIRLPRPVWIIYNKESALEGIQGWENDARGKKYMTKLYSPSIVVLIPQGSRLPCYIYYCFFVFFYTIQYT